VRARLLLEVTNVGQYRVPHDWRLLLRLIFRLIGAFLATRAQPPAWLGRRTPQ